VGGTVDISPIFINKPVFDFKNCLKTFLLNYHKLVTLEVLKAATVKIDVFRNAISCNCIAAFLVCFENLKIEGTFHRNIGKLRSHYIAYLPRS
jgi:hypothetical protein